MGMIPIQYVDASIGTLANGATKTMPAKTAGGDYRAKWLETATLTIVPNKWPKIRI
jgi:hypothetical protein